MSAYLLILFVFVSQIKLGWSITCYDCNSLYDPRCGDAFDPFSLGVVNCSVRDPLEHMPEAVPQVCRTIKMEIDGKIRVVRQCGYIRDETTDQPCYRKASSDKLFVTYCSCTQDLCNSAERVARGALVASVSLLLCIYKLLV